MGRETILFKTEERKNRSEIATILRLIADKVEEGKVSLSNNAQSVEVSLPENMVLEIKVEEEVKHKKKYSLEIELEWTEGGQEPGGIVIN